MKPSFWFSSYASTLLCDCIKEGREYKSFENVLDMKIGIDQKIENLYLTKFHVRVSTNCYFVKYKISNWRSFSDFTYSSSVQSQVFPSASQLSLTSLMISEHIKDLLHFLQFLRGFFSVALRILLQVALYRVRRSCGSSNELQTSSRRSSWLDAVKNPIC